MNSRRDALKALAVAGVAACLPAVAVAQSPAWIGKPFRIWTGPLSSLTGWGVYVRRAGVSEETLLNYVYPETLWKANAPFLSRITRDDLMTYARFVTEGCGWPGHQFDGDITDPRVMLDCVRCGARKRMNQIL